MSAIALSSLRRLALPCLGLMLALLAAMPAHALHDAPPTQERRLRVAVLGDSDSHGFQDRVSFPSDGPARGGKWQAVTLQWTEILAQQRNAWLDFGPREHVGVAQRLARVAGWVGSSQRTPHKLDHLYNFAVSGALCSDLNDGRWKESQHLSALIAQEPSAWDDAVVVIRIGINELGIKTTLDAMANNPAQASLTTMIDRCSSEVIRAVTQLRQANAHLRFVLVGIYNNAHWARFLDHWRDPRQLRNIDRGLDRFDDALRALADRDPRIAFFDDRRLFESLMGGRDSLGRPAYRALRLGTGFTLTNTIGDAPHHFTLGDGHNGTVWNGLWANHLLALLEREFSHAVPPLSHQELLTLIGH